MKFGQHLQSVSFPEWRFYYIDYDGLKKQLKGMSKQGDGCPKELEVEFQAFLDKELEKVVSFQSIKSEELNRRVQHCEAIINNIIENPTSTPQVKRISRLEEELSRITRETNELAKYARLNYTGFLKITKKHDKHTPFAVKSMFMAKMNAKPFYRENFDALILKLSKLYDLVRTGGEGPAGNVQAEGGSQSFVRKTTKYWVHPDNVTEVKLHILKSLPVLVFGSTKEYDPAITSIYFDNDQFELYKGRLEKTEGAQAIRFRWYGSTANQEIFIERKTHREDWTGEKSVKERFPLKEKYVNDYMDGTFTMEKQVQKLRERGQKSDKELEYLTALSTEIQQAIVQRKLKPMMRTFYNRTAFQLPGDARVRISLDTELTMVREDNYDDRKRAGSNWRRTDIGTDWPFNQLEDSELCRFPYAVLEVKLQTHVGAEPPAWVTELINSHLVEEVPKFSKFIHGCATLLENRVSLLPFWLPQMHRDIRKASNAKPIGMSRTASSTQFDLEETRIRKGKGKTRSSQASATESLGGGGSGSEGHMAIDIESGERVPLHDDLEAGHGRSSQDHDEEDSMDLDETSRLLSPHQKKEEGKGILSQMGGLMRKLRIRERAELRRVKDPRALGIAEPGSLEGIASSSSTNPNELIPGRLRNKRIVIPVRVEPKVFFANERTFLAWMHFSSVIAGLALGLLNFGDRVGQIAGIIFTINAMIIMAYGLYLFLWRMDKIRNREAGPYDDRGGPTFIVITLFLAMVLNFWLKLSSA